MDEKEKINQHKREIADQLNAYSLITKFEEKKKKLETIHSEFNVDPEQEIFCYKYQKKIRIIHWIIIFSVTLFLIFLNVFISHLVNEFVKNPTGIFKKWAGMYFTFGVETAALFLVLVILSILKVQKRIKFWKDKSKKFVKTYQDDEAIISLIIKISFMIFLLILFCFLISLSVIITQ